MILQLFLHLGCFGLREVLSLPIEIRGLFDFKADDDTQRLHSSSFWGLIESHQVIPKRNYYGASG